MIEDEKFDFSNIVPSHSPSHTPPLHSPHSSPSHTTPPLKYLPSACVFVVSVSPQTTSEQLKEHFEKHYGPVGKSSTRKDPKSNRIHAFIQFIHPDHAKAAIDDSDRQSLHGHRIRVQRSKVNTTLFVAHVDRSLRNLALRKICEEFGEVDHVNLLTDPATRQSKGCGFVRFVYREDARDALEKLPLSHPDWIVEWSKNSDVERSDADKLSIFVAGPDAEVMTEENLGRKFSAYGKIVSINVIRGKGDDKKVFAFVHYSDQKSTFMAIESENNADWFGQKLRVELPETSQSRNEKKKKREREDPQTTSQYYPYPFAPPPPIYDHLTPYPYPYAYPPPPASSHDSSPPSVPSIDPYYWWYQQQAAPPKPSKTPRSKYQPPRASRTPPQEYQSAPGGRRKTHEPAPEDPYAYQDSFAYPDPKRQRTNF